jgi:hypothetical protein
VRRAVDGVDEDRFFAGTVIGQTTRYSDKLLMFLLQARRPRLFAARLLPQISGQISGQNSSQNTKPDDANSDLSERDDGGADAFTIAALRRRMARLDAPDEPADN